MRVQMRPILSKPTPNLEQEARQAHSLMINPDDQAVHLSRGRTLFYTAWSGNGLERMEVVCPPKLTLRKRHFFVIEKYIEDARQDEKHVPDLLEATMRPTDPVKEELRSILFKMTPTRLKTTKIKVPTFWIPEIQSFPSGGQCQPARR